MKEQLLAWALPFSVYVEKADMLHRDRWSAVGLAIHVTGFQCKTW